MSWEEVLAATAHLVDLYDSRKEPGLPFNPSAVSSRVNATESLNNRIYFDIGVDLIEILDSFEEESHGMYVSIESVLSQLRDIYPSCNDHDFLYVVYKLSTRFVLSFSRTEKKIKDPALIDRISSANRIRLSSKGRIALALPDAAEDWMYADIDADKITRSIIRGDFEKVLKYTISLAQSVKDARVKVVKILERPNKIMNEAIYKENQMYSDTASKIQKSAISAQSLMRSPETQKKLDNWIEARPVDFDIEDKISRKLSHILSHVDVLSRKISDIINYAESGTITSSSFVYFDDIAKKFAESSVIERAEMSMKNTGFWKTPAHHGSVYDVIKKIKIKSHPSEEKMTLVNSGHFVENIISSFRDKYGDNILNMLEEKPLSLIDLIEKGRFGASDIQRIGDLIGIFIDATPFGFDEGMFWVSMDSQIVEKRIGSTKYILNNNLLLHYKS